MYFIHDMEICRVVQGSHGTHKIVVLVGCKHRASEGVFYIGGRGFVCQIFEPVTFARLYLHCGISHWADI